MNRCICQGQSIVDTREGGENRLEEGVLENGNDWRLTFSMLTVP